MNPKLMAFSRRLFKHPGMSMLLTQECHSSAFLSHFWIEATTLIMAILEALAIRTLCNAAEGAPQFCFWPGAVSSGLHRVFRRGCAGIDDSAEVGPINVALRMA